MNCSLRSKVKNYKITYLLNLIKKTTTTNIKVFRHKFENKTDINKEREKRRKIESKRVRQA